MVRHDDVHTALPGDRDFHFAAGPAVGRDDEGPPFRRGEIHGPQRQPMAIAESLRGVGSGIQAELLKGQHQDRESGETIGVEIAVHQDALASLSRLHHPGQSGAGIREQPRIVDAFHGRAEEASQVIRRGHAPGSEYAHHALGQPGRRPHRQAILVHRSGLPKNPAKPRLDHDLRMTRPA